MQNLLNAFALLTTLPFARPRAWQPGDSGRAAAWYPLAGLIIGAFTCLAWKGALSVLPASVAGVLALGIWVGLTGGLHLDGLADCCDGLLASASPERRLEIMKDPRLGVFGGIGLILILFLKGTVLATLTPAAGLGIMLAASLARWCVLPAALLPLARPDGLAADFVSGLRRSSIFIGALIPLGLSLVLGMRGFLAVIVGLSAAVFVMLFARSRIGGVTGDVFGMLVEVVETAALLAFLIKI
jgi:adenosylcobinamide-GDP ribazoletransferase